MKGRTFLILSLSASTVIFVITLGIALYGSAQLRESRASDADIKTWRAQALDSLENGNLETAQFMSEKVLRHRPADAIIRANLGRTFRRLSEENSRASDLYRAIAEHKLAIASRPELPDLYYNVACYYAAAEDLDAAFDWLVVALDKGFGRKALLEVDPDLAELRSDPRFRALKKTGRLPRREPVVSAQLTAPTVAMGQPAELRIVVERMVPEGTADGLDAPEVEWEPDGTLELVERSEKRDRVAADGWTLLRTTVRIRMKAPRDGLFAVPAATVKIGERTYTTRALVLKVEPTPEAP